MSNIIQAFLNIMNNSNTLLPTENDGRNRINNVGKALETFVQNAFADTFHETNEQAKLSRFEKIYSYQGNQNNPPDLMLRNSDAIEVKKLQSKNSAIALNSSYPKAKLYADSPMITKACKSSEVWESKDILYAIGHTDDESLKSLWLVYGDCFCADKETYERIKNTISEGIQGISDVEFTQTKELGKVKKVDPLGITDLRIRGMWHIDNPHKIFDYIYHDKQEYTFQLTALIQKEKYDTLLSVDKEKLENSKAEILDVKIKSPNNPVVLIDAKLLMFKV